MWYKTTMSSSEGKIKGSASLRNAMKWIETDEVKKRKSNMWKDKMVYIIIGIIFLIIVFVLLYLYYRNNESPQVQILDNLTESKGKLPLTTHSTPYRPPPRSPITYMTPPASYRPKSVHGSIRPVSYVRPSPGGTSIISPNARIYPTTQNGVEGLMVYPK